MEQAIVTIYIPDREYSCDLEVPTNIKIEILIQLIIKALKLDSNNYKTLKCKNTGEILKEDTTLAEKGLWAGSILILE
ncbi:EsaB/YukD family protein [Defluviitalea phaphyphila]|uniref:EsaB/YukD family protein n=1 Tax=Defluviitalea phaphyphila TaxID=1473580 RepID=UPI0007309F08|nr:EsaB/YukD family protein [Defluviitalea phaphyphila]